MLVVGLTYSDSSQYKSSSLVLIILPYMDEGNIHCIVLQESSNPFASMDDTQLRNPALLRVKATIPKAISLVSSVGCMLHTPQYLNTTTVLFYIL